MFIKLRNYQDDAWIVVNTDYIISMERISGGSIITTARTTIKILNLLG